MESLSPLAERLVRGWSPYVILVLLCCALYLPGINQLPPTDSDEARFAQASRQMLETGNFIDIRFQDEPRYKKPIGIYWLQSAVAALTVGPQTPAIWPYRLPSVAGALLAVLLTFRFGSILFDRRTALFGAVLLAGCLTLTAEAHLAKTDAMLLASIVAMQGLLGSIYLQIRSGKAPGLVRVFGFWAACGCGIMLKGPIPPLIALLSIGALAIADRDLRSWRVLRPLRGSLLVMAIVLPWLIAITLASKGAFLSTAVGSDLLPKLIGGHESHGAPPGYYLLLLPALFWPGSLFALWALWPSWKQRTVPAVRFCLAWLLPFWLLFELIPTKLPHYVLPTLPALALLTAHALSQGIEWSDYTRRGAFKVLRWLPIGLWGLTSLLLGGGLAILPLYLNHQLSVPGLVALAGAIGMLWWVWRCWQAEHLERAAIGALLAGLLVLIPAGSVLSSLQGPWISPMVQQAVSRHSGQSQPLVAAVGFSEPSLVFLLGTQTRLTSTSGAVETLASIPGSFALIEQRKMAAFREALEAAGLAVESLETLHGFNYSKGKWLTLELFRQRPGASATEGR